MQKLIASIVVFWGIGTSTGAAADSTVSKAGTSEESSIPKSGISGQVDIDKNARQMLSPNGILYVFARETGDMMPLVAVVKFPHPKFPVKFTITEADRVELGFPFTGPFNIRACYSPSGQECGRIAEASDPEHPLAHIGQKDIRILIRKKPLRVRHH